MREVKAEQVLEELAEIAFSVPGEEGGLPVKVADKLRALELLYKCLGLGENGALPEVTILDDLGAVSAPEKEG